MSFRSERHQVFERAIRETVDEVDRNDYARAIAADLLLPAFRWYQTLGDSLEKRDGRTRRDIHLSVARQTSQSFGQSWLARSAMKMLGAEKILDASLVYADRVARFSKNADIFRREQEKYDANFDKAEAFVPGYHLRSVSACRLYASLKTWGDDKKLQEMSNRLWDYSMGKWELVIEGPMRLLLQVGSEGFLVIWRALNWSGNRDEPRARDAKAVAEDIEEILRSEDKVGVYEALDNLLVRTLQRYVGMWMDEQMDMRVLVPPDGKDRFFSAFEAGKYFQKVSAETTREDKSE